MADSRPTSTSVVPAGIDRLVALAAGDRRFRVRLFADRERAARSAGVRLSETERALLLAIPDEQLLAIIEAVPEARAARRSFLQSAAAWACGLLGGAALVTTAGCPPPATAGERVDRPPPPPTGSRPDVPPPPPPKPEEPKEAPRGAGADTGIRADIPPEKGG
jgi:hypothetical protein